MLEAAKYLVETSELFQNEHIEVQENWLNNINSAPISEHDDWEEFVNSSIDQTDELRFSEPIEEPQGSTLTFQLTSLVASDNLDVTSQKKFLLAKRKTSLHLGE